MERLYTIIKITLLIFFTNVLSAFATHVAGAEITYKNVGVDSFLVTVNIFEDCGGAATLPNTITVYFSNNCGFSDFNSTFNRISTTEVSQLCPSEQGNSTCNGGTLPGMRQKVYQKVVVLQQCNSWTIKWGVANRNASVNLDPPGNTLYFAVTATLNNSGNSSNNNSPEFYAQPIPYVCANQLVNYSFGVSELDGDSIVYTFADPLGGTANNPTILTYQPGYTVQQPIPGIVLDPVTGLLSFTPTLIGGFVVVVQINEYRNGVYIGSVRRDIQFVVRACTNTAPDIIAGEISNLVGDAVKTGSYTIEMCEGNTFSFEALYSDQDAADVLTITSNITTVLPGAVVTTSGTNPILVTFSWTAPSGSSGQNNIFTVSVNDGACPIPGQQNFVYYIDVIPTTYILPAATTICTANDSVQLSAFGGTIFNWYDISGNLITPNNQFSCNQCPNPIAKPTVTTSYIVESNLSSTCVNRDTIVVTIAPSFSLIALAADTVLCTNQQVQLNAQTTNGGNPYTFSWIPTTYVSDPNISNPTATFSATGFYDMIVTTTSAAGCSKKDTVQIHVYPAPTFSISSYGPYCSTDAPIDLEYNVPDSTYTENWTGSGIIDAQTGMFNPAVAGEGTHFVTLNLSVPGGCTAHDSIPIVVNSAFNAAITTTQTAYCKADSPLQLTTATPNGTWNVVTGLDANGIFNPATAPIGPSVIIYSFTGACPSSDTLYIQVNQNPPAPTLTQNAIACTGTNLPTGAVSATGISGGTVSWFISDNLQDVINTGNTFNGVFTAAGNVYAYDSINGCPSEVAMLAVNFYPSPTAQFTVDPVDKRGEIPFQVNLSNGSTGYTNWFWNFGDSSLVDSTNFNTSHTFVHPGKYNILLTVKNSYGCLDTLSYTIIALEQLVIPNIFTPNGDGQNDYFYFQIDANTVNSFKATILDRWGKKVTEFNSTSEKWDGSNYPAGTYYYIIEATDINNQPFKHTHGFFKMMK